LDFLKNNKNTFNHILLVSIKLRFSELSRPFIVGVISERTIEEGIRTLKLGEFDGADCFQWELHKLEDFPPSKEDMRDLFSSTNKPIWTTNRRGVKPHTPKMEEVRMKLQIDAIEIGASGIDMEMDTFDHWLLWDQKRKQKEWENLHDIPVNKKDFPHECSFNKDARDKQLEIIDTVHSLDAEVLMSCHVLVRTTDNGILKIVNEMDNRGADLIKIVVRNDDFYDLCDTLRANIMLKENTDKPFKLMSQGEPSKLGRVLYPMFGSAWAFGQQDLLPGGFHYRPLISTLKYILQHVDWQPNWEKHFK
jgi:hypothetical protein